MTVLLCKSCQFRSGAVTGAVLLAGARVLQELAVFKRIC